MKRGQITQFIIAGLIILVLLLGENVNADLNDCKKATDLAEESTKNNMFGYNKIIKPEPSTLVPEDLKKYVKSEKFDNLGNNFNLEYLDEKGKNVLLVRSTISKRKYNVVVNLADIAIGPDYQGLGRGTQLFRNLKGNVKIYNNNLPVVMYGQAANRKLVNYWASLGAKFPRNSYRKTITINGKERLLVALEEKPGSNIYKYYNEVTGKEEVLKNQASWQFIKGEKPKDTPVPDTEKAIWWEY